MKQYIFISSISVYADNSVENQDETSRVATTPDPTVEKITEETFGPLKALCEQAVAKALPKGTTVVRPGYIVGPDDPSGRFTYWPVRLDRGGEALIPGGPKDPVQIIDVRDLGAWLITLIEEGTMGTFNAAGPRDRLAWGDLVDACQKAGGGKSKLTWVSGEWVEKQGEDVFPIWAPYRAKTLGFHTWSNARAVKAGLKFRSYTETAKDTLAWYKGQPEGGSHEAGGSDGGERGGAAGVVEGAEGLTTSTGALQSGGDRHQRQQKRQSRIPGRHRSKTLVPFRNTLVLCTDQQCDPADFGGGQKAAPASGHKEFAPEPPGCDSAGRRQDARAGNKGRHDARVPAGQIPASARIESRRDSDCRIRGCFSRRSR